MDEFGHLMTLRKKNIPEFSTYPRDTDEVRLEEIYGMMIGKMKQNAESTGEREFLNGVFTI